MPTTNTSAGLDHIVHAARKVSKHYLLPAIYGPVFHYTCARNPIITTNSLLLSRFDYLNDDQEYIHAQARIKQYIEERQRNNGSDLFESILNVYDELKKMARLPYILSVCRFDNNEILRHRYANCPEGTVLGIKFKDLILSIKSDVDHGQIIYDDALKDQCINDVLDAMLRAWRNTKLSAEDAGVICHIQLFLLSIMMKDESWSQEKEYRLILWKKPSDNTLWRLRPGSPIESSWLPYVHLDLPVGCLTL